MTRRFFPRFLLAEAGAAGAGAAPAPAAPGAPGAPAPAPGAPAPAPGAPAPAPNPWSAAQGAAPAPGAPAPAPADAPPAWAAKLLERIGTLEQRLAPKQGDAGPGKPTPEPAAGQASAEPPAWAKAIEARLDAQDLGARKSKIYSSVLARIPEANRGAAELALDGLVGRLGLDLGKVDESTAIQTLGQSLGANASQLFQAQGSSRSAMPVAANGDPDWSRVTSFDEVPAELVASIPDDVVARIQRGGAGGSSSALPRNIFTHPTPK